MWPSVLGVAMALSVSLLYERIEWGAAVALGQGAEEFLGTQGDVWDTQSDMGMALLGAVVAVMLLGRWHDRPFTSGHGSPYVAAVSIANAPKLYKAMLDGLEYRGTAFFQCYTTCQPEHGVGDNMSAEQAKMVRDARGVPEFVYNPRKGEAMQEAFDLKGNPSIDRDWWRTKYASTGEAYNFGVAHWALTEGRFRKHLKKAPQEDHRGRGGDTHAAR